MDDPEYKRLKRFIVVSWALLLAIICALVFWGTVQIKNLKSVVESRPQIIQQKGIDGANGSSIIGPSGASGATGIQGESGVQGIQGTQGISGVTGEAGPQGPQGPQGDPGPAGKIIYIRQNPVSGELECKYGNDTFWLPVGECE